MIGEQFQVEETSRVIGAEKVLYYGKQLLEALAFLHNNNIIHRDIKPHNILVTDDDRIKICDFGMSLVEGVAFSGPDTMQVGSPYYTPPEQRKDPLQVDGRADLYSAAVMLYRMLTGNLPGMQSISLSQVNPRYSQEWDGFFVKALSWNPDLRFNDGHEMLASFSSLQLLEKNTSVNTACSPAADQQPIVPPLRIEPVNVCKSKAGQVFMTNQLFKPLHSQETCLQVKANSIIDTANQLVWMRTMGPYPLSQKKAFAYIGDLNQQKHGEAAPWRLPTVNELLTLVNAADLADFFFSLPLQAFWLWSCDRHGNHEGWYVNLDMGFTGTQDTNCLNYVLPVRTYISE